MPKLSVVMSVYKEPTEWITQSIDSILNQTFRDFEFIIINDNPEREENESLLNSYSQKDKRIVLIKNEQNLGLTKSLNIGINEAKGKYIVRMDADDYSFPERLEKQVQYMESHPEIVASGCYARLMNEEGKDIGYSDISTDIKELKAFIPFRTPIYHPSAIIRRVIDGELLLYNESFRYSQDYELWSRLIEKGIGNIPERLISYRTSKQQISSVHKNSMRDLDVQVREYVLKRYYLCDDEECNKLLSLYYCMAQKSDCSDIISALKTVNDKIVRKQEISIPAASKYLLNLYCLYLADHFSLYIAINKGCAMKNYLHVSSYRSVLSIIKRKIYNGIQKGN